MHCLPARPFTSPSHGGFAGAAGGSHRHAAESDRRRDVFQLSPANHRPQSGGGAEILRSCFDAHEFGAALSRGSARLYSVALTLEFLFCSEPPHDESSLDQMSTEITTLRAPDL